MPLDELIASLPSEVLEKPARLESDDPSSSSDEYMSANEDGVSLASAPEFYFHHPPLSHGDERWHSLCPCVCIAC